MLRKIVHAPQLINKQEVFPRATPYRARMNVQMKTLMRMLLIGCVMAAAPFGQAINYTNTDLLLVFRQDGFNDVEFDVGPVSSYLQAASGTQKNVSFDLGLVQSNFNN